MSQEEIISFLKIILEVNPSHKEAKLKLNNFDFFESLKQKRVNKLYK